MPDGREPSSAARSAHPAYEPDVTVRYLAGSWWRADCTCGWKSERKPGSPQGRDSATRAGATHLWAAHGVYAGGHYA